jgi:hypothetical protein
MVKVAIYSPIARQRQETATGLRAGRDTEDRRNAKIRTAEQLL